LSARASKGTPDEAQSGFADTAPASDGVAHGRQPNGWCALDVADGWRSRPADLAASHLRELENLRKRR